MRKNIASQVVCAQLLSSTTGAAVTSGTTTVYVLGDGGTQAEGAGTVTHKGNGCWSYAPPQAETNYGHVAFTFVNASALTATVQVYTISYDSHDTAGLGLSRFDAAISSRLAGASYTAPDNASVAAIKAKTDNLPAAPAAVSNIPTTNEITIAVLTTAMAESYAADGEAPTLAQLLHMLWATQSEKVISGTTMTVKKLDGATTAMTFTLNSATEPTSITRST
jgi:hypothetical protein